MKRSVERRLRVGLHDAIRRMTLGIPPVERQVQVPNMASVDPVTASSLKIAHAGVYLSWSIRYRGVGNDINHPGDRVRSIERAARTACNFHALDVVERQILNTKQGIVETLIQGHVVDKEENSRFKTAYRDIRRAAAIGRFDVVRSHSLQELGEIAGTGIHHVTPRHDRGTDGCVEERTRIPGR